MPLEQIRPSVQLYQTERAGHGHRRQELEGLEEVQERYDFTRPENMNLLKLGGVGGVTRSGSWGRHQSTSREALVTLTNSPEEHAPQREDMDEGPKIARAQSLGDRDHQRKPALDHFRSGSSDVPSSSSRTSTSSYSAAAFSLRSVSNRDSVSSTTSSGTSSRSPTAASEDESTATNTSCRVSQVIQLSSNAATNDESLRDARTSARVGPGVNRVRSIGRGGDQGGPGGMGSEQGEQTVVQETPEETTARPLGEANKPAPLALSDQPLSTLTLSAAAAAASPVAPLVSISPFVPPAPRRHTGAFTLRSFSALSQSGGAFGSFSGGGGGRAAAREMARNAKTYDNAPFSELEARRIKAPSSPFRKPAATAASQPTSPFALQAMQSSSSNAGGSSLLLSPSEWTLAGQSNEGGGPAHVDHPSSDESPHHSNVSRFRDAASAVEVLPISLKRGREGSHQHAPMDVDVGGASPAFSSSLTSRRVGLGINADSSQGTRAGMVHSNTGNLVSANVLRTPTTEEWSRFLAKQGVDPAVVAASSAGRVRTSTGRSTASRRRHHSDRKGSHNTQQKVFARRSSHFDVESDGDDSDNERLMESMRQIGLARPDQLNPADSLLSINEWARLHDDDTGEQDSDGGEDSSSDERMQALHEAISRPPSRRGTPPSDMLPLQDADRDERLAGEYRWMRIPSREAAAAVTGYTLPPPGERRKIDDFVIVSDIGRGAYGLVKRAKLRDEVTGEGIGNDVCIKYIIKSRILADCWRRHKVLGPIPIEIHVMDQLRRLSYKPPSQWPPWSVERLLDLAVPPPLEDVGHPSLCKMLDFFEDHEFYYMVMPCFGRGQDLFDHVESQPHGLSSLQVRCIFGQIADGLRFLHHNNIVHRDVKDENVILDGKGHVQIIDFGSAAHIKNGRPFDTFSGTLDYAAAEILRGEKYGGKEQDVWALGVMGYVLLCGDCPFWNGEEAIQGLRTDSRAYHVLHERCSLPAHIDPQDGLEEQIEQRRLDLAGQADGGGQITDAVDLIQCCLELDYARRPTMDLVCQHRFLIGHSGWHGPLSRPDSVQAKLE